MKRKHKFESPTVLQAVDLSLEGGILKGSIVDEGMFVTSVGQEVTDIDASSTGEEGFDWNSKWEWE